MYLSICSSVENFREKLAEIKGIPHFTNEATEEYLQGTNQMEYMQKSLIAH
ncbi:hypothetical protein CHCC20348_1697 [Bacillus paralicheniformis]|nr:hypothetical protein CHCC20348_1697 [Bacillus paralicheniformis]